MENQVQTPGPCILNLYFLRAFNLVFHYQFISHPVLVFIFNFYFLQKTSKTRPGIFRGVQGYRRRQGKILLRRGRRKYQAPQSAIGRG